MLARFRARWQARRLRRRLARQLGFAREDMAKVDAIIRFYTDES